MIKDLFLAGAEHDADGVSVGSLCGTGTLFPFHCRWNQARSLILSKTERVLAFCHSLTRQYRTDQVLFVTERKCECPDGTSSISSPCALNKPGAADFCETTFEFHRQNENKLGWKSFECGSEQKGSAHKLNCKWFSGSCRGRRVWKWVADGSWNCSRAEQCT